MNALAIVMADRPDKPLLVAKLPKANRKRSELLRFWRSEVQNPNQAARRRLDLMPLKAADEFEFDF